jgi:type II secretory pathway component PulJ
MKPKISPAVTLVELLIAIVLLSLVVLNFSSLDLFSRHHVITADRRVKVQNEVSLAMEHMAKQLSRAIGNIGIQGPVSIIDPANSAGVPADFLLQCYIDADASGGPGDGQRNIADRWIGYRLNGNQLQYCSQCTDNTCAVCAPASWELVADNITGFISTGLINENNITLTVSGCWDADNLFFACGSPDNPSVTMHTRIKMPSVSVN